MNNKNGINFALNEATVLDAFFDNSKKSFSLVTLPVNADANGVVAADNRLTLRFSPVGRLAISYRQGRWDDRNAQVSVVKLDEIHDNIQRFGPFAIYGDDFIDNDDQYFKESEDRLSLDYHDPEVLKTKHTFEFSRDTEHFMMVKVWFDELTIVDVKGSEVSLDEFVAGAKRAWAAPETLRKFGIQQL